MNLETKIKVLQNFGKIKLEPLRQWKCDACGGIIEKADNGFLEWLWVDETNQEGNFRIVHKSRKCNYRENDHLYLSKGMGVKDLGLEYFVGPDGLSELIGFLNERNLKDETEIYELIRRLHVPYYEQARQYYDVAEEDGLFDGTGEQSAYRYSQRVILDILDRYA
ncbi:hypothetical protein [Thermoactinomyces sp. CICC 10521]|uniref:hypothetical protein n=1 Tax=Thermoactinomyces sp. CICC 10521 TaxID=2767426 RepID=UPI0018DB89FC|nr:hypothetical protein [Thermoactinomyces sp. CICC 10521]MBH8609383.1 hypothetical protein [Thermoactinomyces sp. CICC 10521]